jgi:SecD/SecF fusion protein
MAERRNHLILVALITVALIGSALLAIPASPVYKAPVLGLDLQGGLEVVLEARPPAGRQLDEADLDRSLEIIRNRVDKLGVAEPTITKQGTNQISVELPGVKNADRARELIGQTARLELFDLEPALVGPSISAQLFPEAQDSLYDLLASAATQSLRQREEGKPGPFYLFERKPKELVAGPMPTRKALLEKRDGKVPKGHVVLSVPPKTAVITCGQSEVSCPGVGTAPTQTYYYLFKYDPDAAEPVPQMTGEDLKLSGTRADIDPQGGGPVVLMEFTDDGEDKFQDVTRAEYERGRLQASRFGTGGEPEENFYQHFAIVLDREIRSYPSIDFNDPQLAGGISGGGARITGIRDLDEANDLAVVLQTGALPVEFEELSSGEISATLGEDSLREALRAAIAGLVIVAIFLLIAYRFLGLVAVLGLTIYGTLLYAVILLFNVTLTLPGFAGMILTIGVAADANIVIFERIKEESRAGKSVRAAISAGYAKGFNTIIDANVITAMTAVVLFVLATAGVRGFALMLLIGTAMSVVTAVFATRAMLGLLAGFRWFNSPAFMGAGGTQIASWIQHDYVGKRRIWFTLSIAVVVVSVAAIGVRGLNLGIDFEGGTELTFRTAEPTQVEEVRVEAGKIGQKNAGIRGTGTPQGDDRYTTFQVQTEALEQGQQAALRANLREAVGADEFNLTTVSASFGSQLARSAIQAIIFSLFLVILWITFRFQWKFALATIIALIHDLLIATGIYAFTGKEVTTATVAAILTVLGYSMYDSIIILDRVRENIPLMRRASIRTIGNVSLWETIRRSLATTFITLLPITALYFFGGETLKDFAFALLVGIGSGAYSSIFLAVPLVAWLKEREPEYMRRRDGAPTKEEAEEIVEEATAAAADAPVPELAPLTPSERTATNQAKRERRRQRRRTRPHGRAR